MRPFWVPSSNPELNSLLARWASVRIWPDGRGFGNCRCMGVEHNGQIAAVVVAHNYDPAAGLIELSGASDSKLWLTKPVLRTMYDYCFGDAGCQLVVQRISEHSHMADIFRRFGYELHYIPRLRGRDEGEYVCTFTSEAWAVHKINRKR